MNKNRKIISIVCAFAMIAAMFSSFTFASAKTTEELTQGITLDYVKSSDDGLSVDIAVGYKGIEGGISSLSVEIAGLPSQVKAVKIDNDGNPSNQSITPETGTDNGSVVYNCMGLKGTDTTAKVATLTLDLSAPLPKSAKISTAATDSTYVFDMAETTMYAVKDFGAEATKIDAGEATVEAVKGAEEASKAREDADTSAAPAAGEVLPDPVTPNQGITLAVENMSADKKSFDIVVGYKGIEGGISSLSVEIAGLPLTTTSVSIDKDGNPSNQSITPETGTDNGSVVYNCMGLKGTDTTAKVATLTVNLGSALDKTIQVSTAATDSTYVFDMAETTMYAVKDFGAEATKIDAATANAVVESSDKPKDGTDVALSDKITVPETFADTVDGTTGDSNYYIIPEVKKANGTDDADYGEQYEAVIKYTDGNGAEKEYKLTEGQYKNLVNGHFNAANLTPVKEATGVDSIADVIDTLALRVYDKTIKVGAKLINPDGFVEAGKDAETVGGNSGSGDKYVASTAKLAKSKSQTATLGKEVTNTFTITPGSKNGEKYAYGDATFQLDAASLKQLTLAGVEISFNEVKVADEATTAKSPVTVTTADKITLPESADGKYTIKFTAGATGKVSYTVTYAGKDNSGTDKTFEDTVTYTVSEAKSSTSGSGSGSSSKDKDNTSSGGGAIATGIVDSGSSYLPSLGFDDLGDVEWAQNAINTLAAKKIVSGVGDNKFDPNAALTRAAYAQMLVNAIGHSQDSADVEFDDVPTDAWFYHNVAVAAQLGIVAGFGDGTFRPYDLITREQMALMTQKAAVVMGKSLVGADAGTFTDDADIADWSRDAVYQLSNAGIINGMGDGSFAPQANATRAQAAVIIYQAFVK